MTRLHSRIAGLIVAGLLTACSSTMPQTTANLPAATAEPTTAASVEPTPTAEALTPTPGDGPVTASMAQLNMDGERYATLGDPNAPVTVVEFSDYG